jgi:hypothetical protein
MLSIYCGKKHYIRICVFLLRTSSTFSFLYPSFSQVHIAMLSKLFEGFLDDGPQYVLKLVVVVLTGIGLGTEKGRNCN